MLRASQYHAKQRYLESKRRATERASAHKMREREQCEARLAPVRLAARLAAEKEARLRAKLDAFIAEKRRMERLLEAKRQEKLGMRTMRASTSHRIQNPTTKQE